MTMNDILAGALKSKTMWLNGLVTLGAVADVLANNSQVIATVLPGAGPTLALLGVANMVLRAVTNKPLAEK